MKRSRMHHSASSMRVTLKDHKTCAHDADAFQLWLDGGSAIVSELDLLRKTSPNCIMSLCEELPGETNGCSLRAVGGNKPVHPLYVPSVAIPTMLLQCTFAILYVFCRVWRPLLFPSRSDRCRFCWFQALRSPNSVDKARQKSNHRFTTQGIHSEPNWMEEIS